MTDVRTFYADSHATLLQGDVRAALRSLPAGSVHCVVTSPPYLGLRDYGTGAWEGGDPECAHAVRPRVAVASSTLDGGQRTDGHQQEGYGTRCGRCGAIRTDNQIGLEATPAEYIATMVDVFREVRRVLRDDGTVWLNIGDSYAGSGKGQMGDGTHAAKMGEIQYTNKGSSTGGTPKATATGLKPKDLMLIPYRLAIALQDDGWWVRSHIVWAKKAPMPESVQDRPTNAWESIWLLTKAARYFYDAEAVRLPNKRDWTDSGGSLMQKHNERFPEGSAAHRNGSDPPKFNPAGANLRNVWLLGPEPFAEAHFATYPTEIPRRAILAGTSERGCCPACGAPWTRIKEPTEEYAKLIGKSYHDHSGDGVQYGLRQNGKGPVNLNGMQTYRTVDWQPSCACNAGDPIPATVLDPFVGSGTTVAVANQLGRVGIGIDLSAAYLDIALRRIRPEKGLQTVWMG